METLIGILSLIVTITFSIINAIMAFLNLSIAKNQLRSQNDSLRYQLYERRMAIYTSIKTILAKIIQNASVTNQLTIDFLQKTRDVSILFGDEIDSQIQELYKMLCKLYRNCVVLDHNTKQGVFTSDHTNLCNQQHELLEKIGNANQKLEELFTPYISFSKYRIESPKQGSDKG